MSGWTVTLYKDTIAPTLREQLGTVKLRHLTASDVQGALTALASRVSTRTVQIARNALVRAIRHAERDRLVIRNVAALVQPHERWAASYRALSGRYRQQENIFAATMADRHQWEQATAGSRRLAIAADAELRRRHPSQPIDPLRSAEPALVSDTERDDLALAVDKKIGQIAQWVQDLAAQHTAFREKLEERRALKIPSEDPGWEDLGRAFPTTFTRQKGAILQPPKPQITPSAKILQFAAERDSSPEAAD